LVDEAQSGSESESESESESKCGALSADDNKQQKALLDRIVAMLTKLGQRGYAVRDELGEYQVGQFDTDTDTDTD
jgi:hypothetical protein